MRARAAALDLDEVRGREDGAEEADVEDVRAVVARGHHAHGHARARLARAVVGQEGARAEQPVVGEIDGVALRVRHAGGDLHGEIGGVAPREHAVRQLVQRLRQAGRVLLAHGEDDGLAHLAADRVAQGVLEEGAAEERVRGRGEEALPEIALVERLLALLAARLVEGAHGVALVREELRGHLGAGVHHGGVHEDVVAHAVEQGVAEGGLAALAAERAVGVEQQPALGLARIARRGPVQALQVVPRRGREPQLPAREILEDGARVAPDGAVRLVRNHEVEIRGRKEPPVLVVEEQRLHRADHDVGGPPVVAALLVDDRAEIVAEQLAEHALRLRLQLQPVHQEERAAGVAGAQEQLDRGGGGERLARARGHLEEEAVGAVARRALQGVDGARLVAAQEAQPAGADELRALVLVPPRRLGGVAGPLRERDVVRAHRLRCQPPAVGRRLAQAFRHRVRLREGADALGFPRSRSQR